MKRIVLLFILVFTGLLLIACKINFEDGDATWDNTSDDKETSIELYEAVISETLKKTKLFVTIDTDGEVMKQTVDGTTTKNEFDDFIEYVYVKDGNYYYAENMDSEVNYKSKVNYDLKYASYRRELKSYDYFGDDATYHCERKGKSETVNGVETSEETVKLTITKGEESLVIEATAKNYLIVGFKLTLTTKSEGTKYTTVTEMKFEYTDPTITLPDFSTWKYEDLDEE